MLGNHGRGITNKLFSPLVPLLVRLRISPNLLTIVGTILTVALSLLLITQGFLWQATISIAVVGLIDSLDGILARATNRSSLFGAFLDSSLDRFSDGAIFGSVLYWIITDSDSSLAKTVGIIAGISTLALVGLVPYVRARAHSLGVNATTGIAERTDRLVVLLLALFFTDILDLLWICSAALALIALASFITVWQRIIFTYLSLQGENKKPNST